MRQTTIPLAVGLCLITALGSQFSPGAFAQAPPTVSYVYDDLGRLAAVVDPSGQAAIYNYDAVGNVVSIVRRSASQLSIFAVTPNCAPVGSSVTISGTGFSPTVGQNTVKFKGAGCNDVPAALTSATQTQIVATVPAGATTGPIMVTTPNGSVASLSSFTVGCAPPTITDFSPLVGVAGTPVTITGTSFDSVASQNRVTFNNRGPALVASNTSTTINTTVPPSATSGRVGVATQYGEALSSADFFVPPPPLTAADVEATGRIAFGETKTVTIATPQKVAMLVFDGTAGQRIAMNVSSVTLSWNVKTIFNPDGTTLASNYSGGNGFIDVQTLKETGSYTILINPDDNNTGSATVTLYDVPPDVTGSLVPGTALTVTITTPGQNARLSFSGTAGQRISLNETNVTLSWNTLTIFNPDGSTLIGGYSGGGKFLDTHTLSQTGTYSVVLNPDDFNTGNATLTLYDVPADVTGPIVPGGAPVVVTIATPGQNARLTFTGSPGQRVSLNETGVTLSWNVVTIINPDGSSVASAYSGGNKFIDTRTLSQLGTYTVLLDPDDANTGQATLTLYDVPADVTGSIAFGSPQVVTITTPGQKALLTFNASAGQRIALDESNVTFSWNVVAISNPDGSLFASAYNGGNKFFDTQTLAQSGTYTITVDPDDFNTGSATLTLYNVPADVTGSLTIGGTAVPVAITTPGQNAQLSFNGSAGQQVTVHLTANTMCATVRLLKPDNSVLTAIDTCGANFNLAMQTLSAAGTYSVNVDPDLTATGSMNVGVTSP